MTVRHIEAWVGAFILGALACLLFLALKVSGLGHFWSSANGYTVHAHFGNIGGLKTGAKIAMAGVNIGRVKAIMLDPETYEAKVRLWIDSSIATIPDDSEVSILTAGLLGDNFISILPGFSEAHWQEGGQVPVEYTHSAVMLEDLLAKFVVSKSDDQTSQNNQNSQNTPNSQQNVPSIIQASSEQHSE